MVYLMAFHMLSGAHRGFLVTKTRSVLSEVNLDTQSVAEKLLQGLAPDAKDSMQPSQLPPESSAAPAASTGRRGSFHGGARPPPRNSPDTEFH